MLSINIPNPDAVKVDLPQVPGANGASTDLATAQENQVPAESTTVQETPVPAESTAAQENTLPAEPVQEAPISSNSQTETVSNSTTDINPLVTQALNSGYSADEVKSYLMQTKGLSADDADLSVISSVKDKVIQAKEANYSDEEIAQHLISKGYDEITITNSIKAAKLDDSYKKLDYKGDNLSEQDKATDIAETYKNIYSKYSTLGKSVIGIFNQDTGIEARREINKLNYGVVDKLKSNNIDSFIDPDTGEVMMRDKNGVVTEVDSNLLKGMQLSSGEALSGIVGAGYGMRAGAATGAAVGAIFPPAEAISVPVGAAIGGIAGAMSGSFAGRGADLLVNSKKLSEDLSTKLYLSQMAQAGVFAGVADVIGVPIAKLTSSMTKGLVKGYEYVSSGNINGAYRALKDNLNLTDDQIKEIVTDFDKLNSSKITQQTPNTKFFGSGGLVKPDSFEKRAINIVSQTTKNGDMISNAAAANSARVATVVKQSIDTRAKALREAVKTVNDSNIGNLVRIDLKAYQKDVKDFYGEIKDQGANAVNGTNYRFDLDKTTIQPVMKNIEKNLSDPIKRENFISYANRIEAASQDRTFGGLLEMRSIVNDFKYSKKLAYRDKKALNTVINKIDGQISKAAIEHMPGEEGKTWLNNFSKAKSAYSEMKVTQENVLFKAVNRKQATEHDIQTSLNKYGNDLNVEENIFNPLVEKLSPTVRSKVEGAAIKNLVNKNTIGKNTELQAIDFPQLYEELKGLNISSTRPKQLVNVIKDLSTVYKNDTVLSGLTGNITQSKSQQAIANSLIGKAQASFLKATYNGIAKYAPTSSARDTALVLQASKILKNPLHAATADSLLKQIPVEAVPEMKSLVKELQIETAKKGPAQEKTTVPMYKQSKSGKLTATDGALGRGVYLVDRIKNPTMTNSVVKHDVDVSRMATLDDISTLVGRDVTEKEVRTITNLQEQLADKGYLGIKLNNKAMLFPDSAVSSSKSKVKPSDIWSK